MVLFLKDWVDFLIGNCFLIVVNSGCLVEIRRVEIGFYDSF